VYVLITVSFICTLLLHENPVRLFFFSETFYRVTEFAQVSCNGHRTDPSELCWYEQY
jgi:hypothetical protein